MVATNPQLLKYQEWIRIGKATMEPIWTETDKCDKLLENPPEEGKVKVRILKRIARIFTDKCYSRNPEPHMVAKQPIFFEGPPPIDPVTNMPAIGPDGKPIRNIIDISGQRADVNAQAMKKELDEIGFKAEAKACVNDAFTRPIAVLQIGYERNKQRGVDSIYARRRSIKDIIIDRNAQLYYGQVHDCRFVGVRLKLTKAECESRGIDCSKLTVHDLEEVTGTSSDIPAQTMVDTTDPIKHEEHGRYCVWQLWDATEKKLAYVSEHCSEFPKEPEQWPWEINRIPILFLAFDRLPDKKTGHSPLYDLQEQQKELDDTRTMIHENVIDSRPGTLYDKRLGDDFIAKIADRKKDGYFAVEGLASMPGVPFKRFNDNQPINDLMAVYSILKTEPYEVTGVSDNDRMQNTNATATEAEIVAAAGQLATGERIDTVEDLVREAFKIIKAIMRQAYTEERVIQITGPDSAKMWEKWNPNLELCNYDVDISVGTGQRPNTDIERKQAMELYTLLARDPRFDGVKLGMDVLRAYGKKDPESYVAQQPMMPPPGEEQPGGEA